MGAPVLYALSLVAWPLVWGGGLALWGFLHAHGCSLSVATLTPQILAAIAVVILERLAPHEPAWLRPRSDRLTDALHLVSSIVVSSVVGRTLALGVAVSLRSVSGPGLWPHAAPLAVQLVLALLISELGGYLAHRLLHASQHLWPFHAVHHSAQRLYWLNASRNHPVDMAITFGATMWPLFWLGAGDTLLSLYAVCTGCHLLLQHSNVAQRTFGLRWIFSMAEVHRFHHSPRREEADGNYGHVLIVWDVLFGTRRVPPDRLPPVDVGLPADVRVPDDFVGQLLYPFTARTHRAHAPGAKPAVPPSPPQEHGE